MYYANLQDSGVMAKKLQELGAKPLKMPSTIKRAATSVIADLKWPDEVDYEEDAENFLKEAEKAEKSIMKDEKVEVEVDRYANGRKHMKVVVDDELGPYDLLMTKVDIKKGPYGGNLFYKM
mmetsp:Transcript_41580/g.36963  ORF Transcript_41580/g.36963 Transcript_41580/m.36963 type:complete len:121 (+) Transcript_41580:936-1298(+)